MVTSLLLVPMLKLAITTVGGSRTQQTDTALEDAAEALIAYASDNDGCLPFAADAEGGLPDTDKDGLPATDTGIAVANKQGGDLPWSDLGLAASFRDGDYLRLQYYVANPYAGANCPAGFRGLEWNAQVEYVGTNPNPIYVYDTVDPSDPKLFKITGTLDPGEHPGNPTAPAADETALLPSSLLAVRRGPNIEFAGSESDVLSTRNVFVLIAVGKNRNVDLDRSYVRDSTHAGDGSGSSWSLDSSNDLDPVVFSLTHNLDPADRNNDGDDTLLVMSFLEYKARLKDFDKVMQPICETSC